MSSLINSSEEEAALEIEACLLSLESAVNQSIIIHLSCLSQRHNGKGWVADDQEHNNASGVERFPWPWCGSGKLIAERLSQFSSHLITSLTCQNS